MFSQKTKIKRDFRVLYISYDGILDPTGESQVIPYLRGLGKRDVRLSLISFEKIERIRKIPLRDYRGLLLKEGIIWKPLKYHKNPVIPATLFDILNGVLTGLFLIKGSSIEIVHSRGYISGIIGILLKMLTGVKSIFDMRGFWPEEKVDAGAWRENGFLYRTIKHFEKKMIAYSDEIIVLTESAKDVIGHDRRNITVIPCCVDLETFSRMSDRPVNLSLPPDRLAVSYVGSIGTFYNFEETVNFFLFFKEKFPEAYLLILTNSRKKQVLKILDNFKVRPEDYLIFSVPNREVPLFLGRSEFSLIFYRRILSASGCCPIKFSESLACGVPVIISPGIGDCDQIVLDEKVGVILKGCSPELYTQAFNEIENLMLEKKELTQRCRNVAKKYFSLENGIEKYFGIYSRIK
jgi:glycosyltransferase involved in cell wall biosynthesis